MKRGSWGIGGKASQQARSVDDNRGTACENEKTIVNNKKYKQITTNILKQIPFSINIKYGLLYLFQFCRGEKMKESNFNDNWINIEEAAAYLGVKAVTIRDWIRKGKDIPAHKIGKQWKFKCSELDAWVQSGKSAMD